MQLACQGVSAKRGCGTVSNQGERLIQRANGCPRLARTERIAITRHLHTHPKVTGIGHFHAPHDPEDPTLGIFEPENHMAVEFDHDWY